MRSLWFISIGLIFGQGSIITLICLTRTWIYRSDVQNLSSLSLSYSYALIACNLALFTVMDDI